MGTLQSKLWIHKYFHLGSITFFEKNIFLVKLFYIPIRTSCFSCCRYNKVSFVIYHACTHVRIHTCIYAPTYLFLPLVFWYFQVCSKSFNMNFFSLVCSGADITLRSLFKLENQTLILRRHQELLTLSQEVSVLKIYKAETELPELCSEDYRGRQCQCVALYAGRGSTVGEQSRTGDQSFFWRKEHLTHSGVGFTRSFFMSNVFQDLVL